MKKLKYYLQISEKNIFIILLPICITIILHMCQQKEIDISRFESNMMNYYPRFKLKDSPVLLDSKWSFANKKYHEFAVMKRNPMEEIDYPKEEQIPPGTYSERITEPEGSTCVPLPKLHFNIENKSEIKGTILLFALMDTFSIKPVLREIFLQGQVGEFFTQKTLIFNPIPSEICARQEFPIDIHYNYIYEGNNSKPHYLHLLLVYKNDVGNLYDLYIISEYSPCFQTDMSLSEYLECMTLEGISIPLSKNYLTETQNSLKVVSEFSNCYSLDETTLVMDYIHK